MGVCICFGGCKSWSGGRWKFGLQRLRLHRHRLGGAGPGSHPRIILGGEVGIFRPPHPPRKAVGVLRGKGEAPFPQTPIPQGDISIERGHFYRGKNGDISKKV